VDHCEHRNAREPDLVEHAEQTELVADVEVSSRLVEEEYFGFLGEAAREGRELTFSGRQGAESPTGEMEDAGPVEGSPHDVMVFGGERKKRPPMRITTKRNPILHRQCLGALLLRSHQGDGPRHRTFVP
jgi:hypothetical protein